MCHVVVQLAQCLGLIPTEFTGEGVVAVRVPGQGPHLGGQGHLQGLPWHLVDHGLGFGLAGSCGCCGIFRLYCLGRILEGFIPR